METYRKIIIGSSVVAAVAIIVFIYFFIIPKKAPSPPQSPSTPVEQESRREAVVEPPVPGTQEEAVTPLDIPLQDSDPEVREVLQQASSHPVFIDWLKTGELVRKFVAVVDNIANGQSPANHLAFLRPQENFQVRTRNGRLVIDPQGYERYDTIAAVFGSLQEESLKSLFLRLRPLIDQAYRELGYPEKQFKDTLKEAFTVLLQTPEVEGDIYLEKKVISYAFQDPRLERLNPAQKHLLRSGPQNTQKIQAKLRHIAAALNLDPLD
jgi:hypothetical protein